MVKKRRVLKKRGKPSVKVSYRRKKEEMGRGQVWSVDVLLAVIIFVSVILIFYVTMTSEQKPGLKDLEIEAKDLKIELEKNYELGFIEAEEVNETKFGEFINLTKENYSEVKKKLGVKGDFCIFYEDNEGNIILIGNKTGIGNSSVIYIAGIPCGSEIS
nr:hypothetical protein [Nanoarchaeota archaeon]